MIRNTADGSNTSLVAHSLQISHYKAAALAEITIRCQLSIAEGQLTQAAMVLARSKLEHLMERVGKIADLQIRH